MKTRFTISSPSTKLVNVLIFCFMLLANSSIYAQITESFEDEGPSVPTDGTYKTTFSQGGASFSTSGRMTIFGNTGSAYGAEGSFYYMHSKNTAPATGDIGGFAITTAATSFTITSFAAYIASDLNGGTRTSGAVTFVGNLASGGTATETITINTTAIGTNYDLSNAFTGAMNVPLTALSITLPAGIQYIDLDNIVFTTAPIVANQYSINDVSLTEGNSGTKAFNFTVSRTQTATTGSVTAATANSTASSGTDYIELLPTVVNFAIGESSKTVTVTVNGDVSLEPDELFFVNLSSPVNGVILDGQGVGKIIDDDSVTEPFEGEVADGQNFSQNGFAFSATGALMISGFGGVGSSYSLDTRINNGGTAVGTVGTISITTPATSFNIVSIDVFTSNDDGNTAKTGSVTFTGTPSDGSSPVTYTGTVTASGNNFTTINFAGTPFAGVQLTSIAVAIGSGLNYVALDNFKFGTGTILAQQVSINDVAMIEGSGPGNTNMVFTITRTSNTAVFSVDVALNNVTTTAADFVTPFAPVTLNFTNGGSLTQTVTVAVNRDDIAEPNEIFNMVLSNATNGVAILDGLGIGTINDDDGVMETFEDEVNNATSFSQNSIAFTVSDQLKIRNAPPFGSGSSGFFLDTGIGNGGSPVGSVGSISINTLNKGFKLISLDCWTSNNDGAAGSQSVGSIKFKGTLSAGGTVEVEQHITPTGDIPAGWVKNISFLGTPFEGAILASLSIEIVNGANYVSIDNFNYVTANIDPEMEVTNATDQIIESGGTNTPAVSSSTDFVSCSSSATVTNVFTIKNLASVGILTLSGSPKVVLGGAGAAHFSVTVDPVSPVAALGSSTFTIVFNPSGVVGDQNATVSIANNDLDENPYTFNIKGRLVTQPDATISAEATVCQNATLNLSVPSAGAGATYVWSGNGIVLANAEITTAQPILTGSQAYGIVITDANGCSATGSKNVTVNATTLPAGFLSKIVDVSAGSLFANACEYLAKITPSGPSAVAGNVTVSSWVESTPSFQFVPRHYEITPANAPTTSTATVTLYFTQTEFNAYNATITSGFLPQNPADNTSYVELAKYPGVSVPNDGLPSHYTGEPSIIPVNSVVWNSVLSFWEVTFDVTSGFSGFFLKSTAVPLPVTLVSFSGKETGLNQNTLEWITSDEKNFSNFEIQRSADAKFFETIGSIASSQNQSGLLKTYEFVDNNSRGNLYYRLKMIDIDGSFDLSRIISVKNAIEKSIVGSFYPNPSAERSSVDIYLVEAGNWKISTFDLSGKLIHIENRNLTKGLNTIYLDKLAPGLNLVRFENGNLNIARKIVRK